MSEPEYYTRGGLSPLVCFKLGLLTDDEYVGFLKGNIIKYTIRAGHKSSDVTGDIRKAIDYLHYLDEFLIEKGSSSDLELDLAEFKDSLVVSLDDLKKSIAEFKKEDGN